MSKCVVHMQKMKMSAMGGIESHNQRERESKKNKEIDYDKSEYNYDTVNDLDLNYYRAVKERIADLDLKKTVRKDAVVYCSFIVSSDKEFFERLGEEYHVRKESQRESVMYGLQDIPCFDDCDKEYQEECIRTASQEFFARATEFFQDRYGKENVLNGTVHFDESTPHMHLGVVPVTDGRLSAKALFTPLELKQLQSDFAEKVGSRFDLERGTEGSNAKHLDEITFKITKREEQNLALAQEHDELKKSIAFQQKLKERNDKDLEKAINDCDLAQERANVLKGTVDSLERKKSILSDSVASQQQLLDSLTPKILKAKEFKEQKVDKDFFGKSKNTVTLNYQDYANLLQTATAVENVKDLAKDIQEREKRVSAQEKSIKINSEKVTAELRQAEDMRKNLATYIHQEALKQMAAVKQELDEERERTESWKRKHQRTLEFMDKYKLDNQRTVKDAFLDAELQRIGIHGKLEHFKSQINNNQVNKNTHSRDFER